MPKLLLVTGEASGDVHGAQLARALRELEPSITLVGVGGGHMAQAGVQLLPHIARVDAMGVPGFQQLWAGWKTLRQLSTVVKHTRFDAIVLIDSPGMNLRLAKAAAKSSQRIIYYIAPQVWAWGRRRLHLIRKVIKRILAILPFEESYFRKEGIECDYVGHPLLDELEESYDGRQSRQVLGLKSEKMVVGLLPGSRTKEVQTLLPVFLESFHIIQRQYPESQCILAQADSIPDSLLEPLLRGFSFVKRFKGKSSEVMAASDLVLVASGTATLQAALIGTPMIVVYRTSRLTYQIGKRLVTIPYIGLVNILAGAALVPEILQERATAQNIAQEALVLIGDSTRQHVMKEKFQVLRKSLGSPGASRRAAEIILAEIRL
ncbi:MAG: lipid-A-disaccharide synthase [Nitrospirota bacterium]|nr:lipid-A-disaccharide synthase [Nitrospirota bacterium]MDH5773825.1 lipid-A-disaccharide synthase [Nitrospirota bacterium]